MSEPSRDAYTILVVDDDQDALVLTASQFERQGHRVLTAASADEAINVVLESEVHLAIVDYVMPGMDGAELVRAIREFDPFIQIVIQTAHAATRPSQQTLDELDIQGFHDKSEGPQRLMAWVTVCLRACRLIRRLRERERTQRELLSNLSHEFRAPLNVVHGYASLLLEQAFGAFSPAALAPLRAIERGVRELSDVIDNVLEHTCLEAGTAELSLGCVDIGPLLGELERLGGALLQHKPVSLSVYVDPELPIVESDAAKLRTILRNLFSNAVKFTPQGVIEVRAIRRSTDLVISVRDTGIGIAKAQVDILFEPFRQGDGSSTRRHGGLGLGLALSRQYARLLGGDLTVESEPGRGTTFTLTVPGVAGVTSLAPSAPNRVDTPPRATFHLASPAFPGASALQPGVLPRWLGDVASWPGIAAAALASTMGQRIADVLDTLRFASRGAGG
jgi:signal transduction histidine kinase